MDNLHYFPFGMLHSHKHGHLIRLLVGGILLFLPLIRLEQENNGLFQTTPHTIWFITTFKNLSIHIFSKYISPNSTITSIMSNIRNGLITYICCFCFHIQFAIWFKIIVKNVTSNWIPSFSTVFEIVNGLSSG